LPRASDRRTTGARKGAEREKIIALFQTLT
jgi:hypothetical protein